MIKRIRTRAGWLAIGLTLAGGAFAFAGGGEPQNDKGSEISDLAREDPTAVPDVASAGAEDEAAAEVQGDDAEPAGDGERKKNHGFYVSSAAHGEDVEDTENEISFEAPEDDEGGHGAYVSKVARSEAGKSQPSD